MKFIFIITALFFSLVSPVYSAKVTCNFLSETQISKSGEWLKSEIDLMNLYNIFGDGLVLPLENSLLSKLDSKRPFLAGQTKRGRVYLMGGDLGVEGKLISISGEKIIIYDGSCTVTFG